MRGDTVDGFTLQIHDQDTLEPIIPLSVCSQIKTKDGAVLHQYSAGKLSGMTWTVLGIARLC